MPEEAADAIVRRTTSATEHDSRAGRINRSTGDRRPRSPMNSVSIEPGSRIGGVDQTKPMMMRAKNVAPSMSAAAMIIAVWI
jgi:hypothetical protein